MQYRIGKNIRFYRELAGMSQKQFAEALGYNDRSTIARIELGDRDVPVSKVAEMAKVLRVSPAVFFHDIPEADYLDYIEHIRALEEKDPEKLRVVREILGMGASKKESVSASSKAVG